MEETGYWWREDAPGQNEVVSIEEWQMSPGQVVEVKTVSCPFRRLGGP